jgi:hypothetical protein
MKLSDHLKSRIQKKTATFPAGVYREQLDRKQNEGEGFVRDRAAEQVILQKWEAAFLYSKYVLKEAWPEFETAMMEGPLTRNAISQKAAYNYAADVKRGPDGGVERQISLNGELSANYAINIAGQAWNPENPNHARAINSIEAHPEASVTYAEGLDELSATRARRRA